MTGKAWWESAPSEEPIACDSNARGDGVNGDRRAVGTGLGRGFARGTKENVFEALEGSAFLM